MAYIEPELVAKAKEMDLLTYLKNYEPGQLAVLKMTVSPTIAYEYLTEKRMIDWEIVMECFAKK